MSHNSFRAIVSFGVTALLAGSVLPAAADTLYVRAKGVQLRAGTDAGAAAVKDLAVGSELTVLQKQGMWIQVKDSTGATGWVHKLKVSETKPTGEGGGLLEDLGAGGSKDQYVQEARAGRGVRGLSDLAKDYAKGKKISADDVKAVEWMEGYKTNQKSVQQFLKDGQLGEYAAGK